jgi:lipid-binding SYLF domain-containing protein
MGRAIRPFFVLFALVAGCATVPKTEAKRHDLVTAAAATKQEMLAKDPSLQSLLDQSAGYIVFPEVKSGGFIVGASAGNGVIYEHGRRVGFAELSQGSVGATVGGQKFAELIAVRDRFQLDKIKTGSMQVRGQASAVILKQGAASATAFGENGVAIIVNPIKGAMVSAAVAGQTIRATM